MDIGQLNPLSWVSGTTYDVSGKTVLITGAGQGIGWELAKLLYRRGAQVAIVDVDESSAEAAACARAGGDWNTGTGRCAINAAMCASTAGRWIEGTGCAVDATDEAACKALAGSGGLDGFQGIQWAQGRCVLTYLAGDELASQGF